MKEKWVQKQLDRHERHSFNDWCVLYSRNPKSASPRPTCERSTSWQCENVYARTAEIFSLNSDAAEVTASHGKFVHNQQIFRLFLKKMSDIPILSFHTSIRPDLQWARSLTRHPAGYLLDRLRFVDDVNRGISICCSLYLKRRWNACTWDFS